MAPTTTTRTPTELPVSVTYSSIKGFRYHSCRPDEYLVKTGVGVKAQTIKKKTCVKLKVYINTG